MDRRKPPGRTLTAAQRLALALPTFVFAGYDLARRSFLPMFLSNDLKLPIAAVGWLVALAGFAAIPAELLTGTFGDHGLSRWGRRSQWMVLGTLLIGAGGTGLLLAGRAWSNGAAGWSIVALVIGWALCNVTHGAWALEVGADTEARSQIFGLRSLFGIAGGMAFAGLPLLPVGMAGPPFRAILTAVVGGAVVTHLWLVARVPDAAPVRSRWRWARVGEPLRLLVRNRPNRQLAALFALNGAHTAITTAGYLYLVEFGFGLPAWGPTGVLVQALCAAIGIAGALRWAAGWGAARLLRGVLWANLVLAVALPLLPAHRPWPLLVWSGIFGLFSAVDFMALRVLLGDRLDRYRDTAEDAAAAAAAAASHYAGFHLPFNLCAAAAGGLLLAGYRWLGFEPALRQPTEQLFFSLILLPAIGSAILMIASLYLIVQYGQYADSEATSAALANSTTSLP